jgi:hypothetical protein
VALLVSQDRRHLFVTLCLYEKKLGKKQILYCSLHLIFLRYIRTLHTLFVNNETVTIFVTSNYRIFFLLSAGRDSLVWRRARSPLRKQCIVRQHDSIMHHTIFVVCDRFLHYVTVACIVRQFHAMYHSVMYQCDRFMHCGRVP